MCQGNVACFKCFDVAHHLRFRVVFVKDRFFQNRSGTFHECGNLRLIAFCSPCNGENLQDCFQFTVVGQLVKRHSDALRIGIEEVYFKGLCVGFDTGCIHSGQFYGIKEIFMFYGKSVGRQNTGSHMGIIPSVLRNFPDSLTAVINGKHTGHGSHQGRCRAYIGGGFFPFDVLFTCLKRQAVSRFAQPVHGKAYDTARQVAAVFVRAGNVTCDRASETKRKTKTLGTANGNVCTPCGRFLQNGQS